MRDMRVRRVKLCALSDKLPNATVLKYVSDQNKQGDYFFLVKAILRVKIRHCSEALKSYKIFLNNIF